MNMGAIAAIVYSILLFIGGIIGYVTSHSIASIAMGSIFGLLILASGIGMLKGSVLAFFGAAGLSLLMTLFFAYRFYLGGKFMPGGMMALLGLVTLIILFVDKYMKGS